ncbi:MAG: TonB-dependent receptor [Acidobacteriota bacterium]
MRLRVIILLLVLTAGTALGQTATGVITGKVSDNQGALPGVTVTVTSPSLQGSRVEVTQASGDYLFRALPPGNYLVKFELAGYQPVEANIKVSVGQTTPLDAELPQATLAEEIVVTGTRETVSTTTQAAVTYDKDVVEALPLNRTLVNIANLSPGVTNNAPRNAITMSGARSSENLFLVNGVVVNENLRGQAHDLYIEDAVEETTTSLSGISAEYGRFSGGVIAAITKSGGNAFHGSFRDNVTNDSWNGETPLTTGQEDVVNNTFEATLGGYILRDRLWFFAAGRSFEQDQQNPYYNNETFTSSQTDKRYEGKLTFALTPSHRFVGSYMDRLTEQLNSSFRPNPAEPSTIDPSRELPNTLWSLHYSGAVTDNFFLEGQYSKKEYAFVGSGGDATPGDIANGTNITYAFEGVDAGSPAFCGSCGDERRDNENILVKGSYFLSTEKTGSHDIVFGYDSFDDMRFNNNYQSPSNWHIWLYEAGPTYGEDGILYPQINGYVEMDFWPIFQESQGNHFQTKSVFLNDTWRVSDRFTLSLGVRYDKNDGENSLGQVVADDSQISPRLAATWAVNDSVQIHGGYGRYVAAVANGIADRSGGGTPSWFPYLYQGPPINAQCDADGQNCVFVPQYTTPETIALMFDWFESVGGLTNTDLWYDSPAIRGVNEVVRDLKSPYTDEYTLGFTARLGNKGTFRADLVHREYGDFYIVQRDLSTGTVDASVEAAPGVVIEQSFDLGYVVNDNELLSREYDGLHTQFTYRANNWLNLGGNYTLSKTQGNFDGENTGSGPITSGAKVYPEYLDMDWYAPEGDLLIDQRHKVRLWALFTLLNTSHHSLNLTWQENYNTGTPYGAFITNARVGAYVQNPGYLTPPTTQTYYFTARDAYRTDDIHSTNLALNYAFKFNAGSTPIELFLQPEVINVFNEHGVWNPNTTVRRLAAFNPFTDTPTECPQGQASCTGYNWQKGPSFGQAVTANDYQQPMTFRFSVGFRF